MLALGIETESEETRKDMVKRLERAEDPGRVQEHARRRHQVVRVLHPRLSGRDARVARRRRSTTRSSSIRTSPTSTRRCPTRARRSTTRHRATGCCASDGLVADGVLVLPAARQRPRRARGDGRDQPRQAPLLPAPGYISRHARRRRAGWRSPSRRSSGRSLSRTIFGARVVATGGRPPLEPGSARRRSGGSAAGSGGCARWNRAQVAQLLQVAGRFLAGSSCSRPPCDPRTRRALRRPRRGRPRTSSSRQILKPPAEMRHAAREVAADQEEPGRRVAHRRQRPRASRHAKRRHQQPRHRPVRGAAAGNVAAADDDVGPLALHRRRASAARASGGWLRSASITPTIAALGRLEARRRPRCRARACRPDG